MDDEHTDRRTELSCTHARVSTHPAIFQAHALEHGHPDIVSTGEVHDGVMVAQEGHQVVIYFLEQGWQCEMAPIGGVPET